MIVQAVLAVLVTGRVNHDREAASELSDKEAAKLNPKVSGDLCRWGEWH